MTQDAGIIGCYMGMHTVYFYLNRVDIKVAGGESA